MPNKRIARDEWQDELDYIEERRERAAKRRRGASRQLARDLLGATEHTDSFGWTSKVWDFVSRMPSG